MSEDQHAIGEFGSDCSDEPFGVAVGLWAAGRDLDDPDPNVGEHSIEGGRELSGSVADEEPEVGAPVFEVGDEVAGLLTGPGAGGVGGGGLDVYVSGMDLNHEEHVDPLQRDRAVDVEEIAGQRRRGLGAEKLSPGRAVCSDGGRRYSERLEDPADRGGADPAADLQQFALDALIAPGRVLSSELLGEGSSSGSMGGRPVRCA